MRTLSRRTSSQRAALMAAVLGAIALAGASTAGAAERQWAGGDGAWADAANWASGAAPAGEDVAVFNVDKDAKVDLAADATVAGITFATAGKARVTIAGSGSIMLADGGTIAKAAGNEPTNQTIAAPIRLAGAATFTNENDWIHLANQLILGGPITGAGAITISGRGNGGVALNADNAATFTGPITVASGMLFVGTAGSLGDTATGTTMTGGALLFDANASTAEPFTIAGDATWNSMGAQEQSGPVTIAKGATWMIGNGGGNALTLSGVVAGEPDARIVMTSANTTLAGTAANTFAGKITHASNSGNDAYNELRLGKPGGVNAIVGPIEMSNKAVLLWQADDQIADDVALTLAGGALRPSGHRESLGALTLGGRAAIDMTGGGDLRFADSSKSPWGAKSELMILNWTGSPQRINFGAAAASLTPEQVAMIGFSNPGGRPAGMYRATIAANGDLAPGDETVKPNVSIDLSDAARAKRAAVYEVNGLAVLTGAGTPLKKGTSISFFGDSITWLNGYVGKIGKALASGEGTKDLGVTLHNHGVNGAGAAQILNGTDAGAFDGAGNNASLKSFVQVMEDDKTDVAVLYIGINDVWWRNTPEADFRQQLTDITAAAKARGTTLVIATMAAQGELPDGTNPNDEKVETYAQITRDVAKDAGVPLVDLRKAFVAYWQNHNTQLQLDGTLAAKPSGFLTYDGVHPSDAGNELIAQLVARGIHAALVAKE